jgi:hypothetical protein
MVENETVGDWQKIVLQFSNVGTSVFQLAVDTNTSNSYFTPPNTTNYLDFQIQFTSDYTAFDYISTTGAVVTGDYFPRNESNTSQDVLGNPLQYSGPSS